MISRRSLLAAAPLALAACRVKTTVAQTAPDPRPLKDIAAFPVGCCVMSPQLNEPAFASLIAQQFSQLTPEWEMKMEYILPKGADLADPSTWRFDGPDAIADFAAGHGMRLHGHTLVWYAEGPPAFQALDGKPGFEAAYRHYIATVTGRYRQCPSFDVVNEQVNEEGTGLRDSLWVKNLGQDAHMLIGFEEAARAAPDTVLFLNDYFLERIPRKRAEFLKLAERLLKGGAKLGGLGTQTHIEIDLPPGAIKAAIADLASLGLPIHVSEWDCALSRKAVELRPRADQLQIQAARVAEAAEAFMALPEKQRFAFSVWGLRDKDSWLRRPPNAGDGTDQPLLFDDQGRPKAAFDALARVLA